MANVTIAPVDLKPTQLYAKTEDEATIVELKNKTAALDQGEILSYGCQPIKSVSTKNKVVNPGKISDGVQYQVRLDEVLRTTDSFGNVVDEPIVMYLTIRHPLSSNITPAHIGTVMTRLCGASMKEDGSFRFDDLMLSALAPVAD
jgi:hypothetical protein